MGVCDKRMEVGDIVGVLCSCGHVNLVHDAGGCAMWALRVIAPAVADPPAPTLREQVLGVIRAAWYSDDSTPEGTADAVLAVVADWLAAQPLMSPEETMRLGLSRPLTRDDQRNHDVRLIRGGGA